MKLKSLIRKQLLKESEIEQEYDDCFIIDIVRGGYDVSCGGKFVKHVDEMDDAIQAVRDWQDENSFYPNVWFVDDHGGSTPLSMDESIKSEVPLKENAVKRWVATVEMYVYGRDENAAKQEANDLIQMIDEQADNRPSLVSLVPQQFGKIGVGENNQKKSLIPEIDTSTGINAIKLMLKKNQRTRAYKLLQQLAGMGHNNTALKSKEQKLDGKTISLHAFYSLTDYNIRIEFTYLNIETVASRGKTITRKFDYMLDLDKMKNQMFHGGEIKLLSRQDAVFIINCIKRINPDTKMKSQDFIILQYENTIKENESIVNPVDGMNKRKAINYITKNFKVYEKLKGFFSDDAWQPINGLIGDIQKANIPFEIQKTEYYKDTNGNPAGKIWICEIPFINQNKRPDKLHVRITAAGAGSVQDPLNRYDVTFVIN